MSSQLCNLLMKWGAKVFKYFVPYLMYIARPSKTIQGHLNLHNCQEFVHESSILQYVTIIFINMYVKERSKSFLLVLSPNPQTWPPKLLLKSHLCIIARPSVASNQLTSWEGVLEYRYHTYQYVLIWTTTYPVTTNNVGVEISFMKYKNLQKRYNESIPF